MPKHTRPTFGPVGLAVSLVEALEPRRLLSAAAGHHFTVGRRITPGIQFRPATDARPTGRLATRRVAHTQFVQLLPKGQTKPSAAGSTVPVGLTASQVRQAYGVDTLTFGGITGDGAGQTIAILDAYDHPSFVSSTDPNYLNSDLHKFSVAMGLPDPPSFRKLDQTGGTNYPAANAGWASEIALDVEWAHAMAPMANIVLIEANTANTDDLLEIAANTARNLPGVTAVSMSFCVDGGFVGEQYYDPFFTTPVGHAGVTFLAATGDNGAILPSGGSTKQAGYPADSPNVVAVGGTSLQQTNGAYVSESGWAGSGGGISNYLDKPDYQSSVTLSATQRTTPDVSILADPNTGVAIYDSYNNTNGWFAGYFGGTSLSSPLWAGLVALANQGRALNGLPSLNGVSETLPRLYGLPSSTLHDITTGNNGYAAGSGYDLVTGRGTPVATTLLPALAGGTYSGYTYIDVDNSNTYDPAIDTPLPGVTVYDDTNGTISLQAGESSTVSDANGHYTLDLPGGQTYKIRSIRPARYATATTNLLTGTTAYGSFTAGSFGFFPTNFNLPAGQNNDVTVRLNPANTTLQIFQNTPTSGAPTYETSKTTLANYTLTFTGGGADDTFTVDLTNGIPLIAAAHFVFDGGAQTAADGVRVVAAAGGSAATFADGGVSVGGKSLTFSGVETRRFLGDAGNDAVTLSNLATGNTPTFSSGGGADAITVSGGLFEPAADLGTDGASVKVTVGTNALATFATAQHLAALSISNGGVARLANGRLMLHTGTLSIDSSSAPSALDVADGTVIVDDPAFSPATFVPQLVLSGYAAGLWNGPGIRSSAAAADPNKLHALGHGSGASVANLSPGDSGAYLGETVGYNAAIVRYTLYGDADLNGTTDFNDFLRLQNSFGAVATTWARGDFNFDGNTDFNDFLLLQDTFSLLA